MWGVQPKQSSGDSWNQAKTASFIDYRLWNAKEYSTLSAAHGSGTICYTEISLNDLNTLI